MWVIKLEGVSAPLIYQPVASLTSTQENQQQEQLLGSLCNFNHMAFYQHCCFSKCWSTITQLEQLATILEAAMVWCGTVRIKNIILWCKGCLFGVCHWVLAFGSLPPVDSPGPLLRSNQIGKWYHNKTIIIVSYLIIIVSYLTVGEEFSSPTVTPALQISITKS